MMPDDHEDGSPLTGTLVRLAGSLRSAFETTRRAFLEFLTIPTLVIAGFLLLALLTFVLDRGRLSNGSNDAQQIWGGLFSDAQGARNFLGVIASSIITVTSITLSLLLIAVQQGAASLTSLVFDQFLRRRTNQLYFGFFIGLALYALIVLASIEPRHQPIYGVALAGLLTVVALYMLILLTYTTINQMRPVVIIKSIHDHTLLARERQHDLLRATRRSPQNPGLITERLNTTRSGFLTRIDVAAIDDALPADVEIVILVSIGEYVAFGDPIAEIRASQPTSSKLKATVGEAIMLEAQRDLDSDAVFGIEQLMTIGWTSISTAKSNPDPGLLTIWNLRDLAARWLATDVSFGATVEVDSGTVGGVVYVDNLPVRLMEAFESLIVVASESMQHQSAAQIYRTLASLYPRLPLDLQRQSEDCLMRSLSGLGDHILTRELAASLSILVDALSMSGPPECAGAIALARDKLAASIGQLNSRSSRTP